MPGTVMPCGRTHSQRPEIMHPMQYAGLDVQPAADRVAAPGRDGRRRYRTWQSLGRQVRRGAKGIGIFGYSTKTTVQEVTDDAGKADEKATTRTFYPVRTVFDISDTDGDDIGLPTEVDSARNPHPNASDKAYRRVSTWLTGQGWDVQRVDITGATRGYTDHTEKLVRVAAHLDHINAARVLLHVILHGPDSDFITNEQYAASRTHRGTAKSRQTAPRSSWPTYWARTPNRLPSVTRRLGHRRGGHPHRRRRDRCSGPRDRGRHPARGQHHRRGARPGRLTCNPRACPVHYRAGQDPRVAAKGHFRGIRDGTTRYPPRRPHSLPHRDQQRGAVGAAGCRCSPYVANINSGGGQGMAMIIERLN